MPDWLQIVSSRLDARELGPEQRADVEAELAGHLEEIYDQQRASGLPGAQAAEFAMDQVADWRKLSRQIQRAKGTEVNMNQRTKRIWIPGLITLMTTSAALAMLQLWRVQPHITWFRGTGLTFYTPWLIAQPIFGAVGAYLSRRAGGGRRDRIVSGMFPALMMLAAFGVILGVSLVLRTARISDFPPEMWPVLGAHLSVWVVVPGFALALGALPFLSAAKAQPC